jgi:hypothetical protein
MQFIMAHPHFIPPPTYTRTPAPAQHCKQHISTNNDVLQQIQSIQHALGGIQKTMAGIPPDLSQIRSQIIKSRAETNKLYENLCQNIPAVTHELGRIRSGQEDIMRCISHQHNLLSGELYNTLQSALSELQKNFMERLVHLTEVQQIPPSKKKITGSGQNRKTKAQQPLRQSKPRRSRRLKNLHRKRRDGEAV